MNIKSLMTAVTMGVTGMVAMAQSHEVKGLILDENGQPMCCVNVVLLAMPDSSFAQGTTSGTDGKFSIAAQNEGLLKLTSVGYETLYIPSSEWNGQVQMRENAQMISEVTVKGMLPKTKLTGNSMVTTVEGTVLGQSGSAKEMLGKVPGMMQNGDDLEVIGKGTPIYYINGRRMQDPDELKRLRSEDIREVEVINNPGAQYDATVRSVVRIKTKKRQGDGFGFDVEAANRQDFRYGYTDPSANVNLRYRHNDFEVFGGVNYFKYSGVQDSKLHQWSYLGRIDSLMTIDQKSDFSNAAHAQGINSNLGFDWQIVENHSLGVRIDRHDQFNAYSHLNQESDVTTLQNGRMLSNVLNNTKQRTNYTSPYNWNGNAYWNGRVGKFGFDLNVDFVTSKSGGDEDINEQNGNTISRMASSTSTKTDMIADKFVVTYPIWRGQLSVGEEMAFVTRKSAYEVVNMPLSDSKSEVKEDNIAAFAEYAFALPKVGSISAGLRFEHVGMKYTDLLNSGRNMSRYTNDLYPSIAWANQWGPVQTSLSYSIKTNRPNYRTLDESMSYVNPYLLQQGDPTLKNEKRQEFALTARYKWLMFASTYEKIDDCLTQWSYIYNDDGVILIKFINFDEPIRNFTAYLNASPTWGRFSPNWTVGLIAPNMKQTLADPRMADGRREVSYNKPIYFVSLNNAARLPHSLQLEANIRLQSQGESANFRLRNNACIVGLAVQKCWLKNDALCLRASVEDILQRSGQNIEMDCGYYLIKQQSQGNNHYLDVSVRYSFNATRSKYRGTGAGESQKSRMDANKK